MGDRSLRAAVRLERKSVRPDPERGRASLFLRYCCAAFHPTYSVSSASQVLRLFALLLLASLASVSTAQVRDERFGVALRLQSNLYYGDRSPKDLSILRRAFGESGPGAGFEFSAAALPWLDAVLQVDRGVYPNIRTSPKGLAVIDLATSNGTRIRWSLSGRYRFLPGARLNPYVHAGLSIIRGHMNGVVHTGFGPSFGFGIEHPVPAARSTAFLEVTQAVAFPNQALDLAGSPGWVPDGLFVIGVGVRYRFARPVPVSRLITLSAPSLLEAGEVGRFQASIDSGPDPVVIEWTFSDGGRLIGESVEYLFASPGEYEATASIRGANGVRAASMKVQVVAPDLPVELSAVVTIPLRPRAGETILFRPAVRGVRYSCSWDFGDGNHSDECETSHAYQASGLFTYRLTVSSPGYSVTLQRDLDVESDRCVAVGRLHTVFFHPNSSELIPEMRDLLRENLDLMISCPGRRILVTGAASREELEAGRLADQRALAVFQFYRLMGIPADRFVEPFRSSIRSETPMTWEDRHGLTELK